MRKQVLCCSSPRVPWGAPASDDLSVFEKKEDNAILSYHYHKTVCNFSMVTSQKHHYTNKPTSQYSFIIAYVAILMARVVMYMTIVIEGSTRLMFNLFPFNYRFSIVSFLIRGCTYFFQNYRFDLY